VSEPGLKPSVNPMLEEQAHWSPLAAIMAALIGLLALGVSSDTAMLQREQVRAEVWPYLQPMMEVVQDRLSIGIENSMPWACRT